MSFKEKFDAEWDKIGDRAFERNDLCGAYYLESGSRVEIVWRPGVSHDAHELLARISFCKALQQTSLERDGVNQDRFSVIEPIIGHVAFRSFVNPDHILQDLRTVAVISPYIDDKKLIG